MKPDIEIHIGELVLEGFSAHDRYRIAGAIEKELRRLIREKGFPGMHSDNANLEAVNAGTIMSGTNAKAGTVGFNVANSVYKVLAG